MKKANVLKIACIVLYIGMFFAGCSFKAEIDTRLTNGHQSGGSDYTAVLDGCANENK